jgi:hypothetical protein
MARSAKAKSPKRKRPERTTGLLAAASLAGVGDLQTFNIIREMYDRLAEDGRGARGVKRASSGLAAATAVPDATSDAPWVAIARGEFGQKDYPGPRHNPRVVEYLNSTSLQANDDETSWCSAFVNWCMVKARQRGTNNAAARSWLIRTSPEQPPARMHCRLVARIPKLVERPCRLFSMAGMSAIAFDCLPAIRGAALAGTGSAWQTSRKNAFSAIDGHRPARSNRRSQELHG